MKKRYVFSGFILFVVFLIYSCNSKKPLTNNSMYKVNESVVAPDNCLVYAKIVKVLPVVDKGDGKRCSESPCEAIVEINKVIAYGSAFPIVLSEKKQIKVHFKNSLLAMDTSGKGQVYSLPGLVKGDGFKAEIEALEQMGNSGVKYIIYFYQKQ